MCFLHSFSLTPAFSLFFYFSRVLFLRVILQYTRGNLFFGVTHTALTLRVTDFVVNADPLYSNPTRPCHHRGRTGFDLCVCGSSCFIFVLNTVSSSPVSLSERFPGPFSI